MTENILIRLCAKCRDPTRDPRTLGQTLGNTLIILLTFCHLKTYNPLSRNFNNITRWLNLTHINLLNNKINELPKKLGTLPCLQRLNLSQNCLDRCKWSWLKQAPIRRSLLFLDISNNSLSELSKHIWKLNALVELKVSHNLLERLSQDIKNIKSLRILDVSHNLLSYLPANITFLRLEIIDISMNPLKSKSKFKKEIPRFIQFASEVLLRYVSLIRTRYPLSVAVEEYVNKNMIESCYICGKLCTVPYMFRANPLVSLHEVANNVIRDQSETSLVLFEFCHCHPACKVYLNLEYTSDEKSDNNTSQCFN